MNALVVSAEFALHEIETGFPRRFDPYRDPVRAAAHVWLREQRLMSLGHVRVHAEDLHYTDLLAGCYVGGPPSVLSAITDFACWFFVWDDRHDRDIAHRRDNVWAHRSDTLRGTLEHPRAHVRHPDPLVAGFADSVCRLFSYLGGHWNKRFADHFRGVLDAYGQEFRNRRTGTVPTVTEYQKLRRHTFAHWIWLDLLELTAQYELPPEIRDSVAYRRAGLACQDFCAWYNDLCSMQKELAAGEPHNIGISLAYHHELTRRQASVETRDMVRARITDFLDAEPDLADLAATTDPALRAAVRSCLFNMRNWMSSTYWFHHESGRYRVAAWQDPSVPPYLSDPEAPDGD